MRIERLRGRARVVDRGDVVSDLLERPGATDDLFDVLAAALAATISGPRLVMLGFAAGGVVAPLRAMGCDAEVVAVDASDAGRALFDELAAGWAGRVTHRTDDAFAWLSRTRTPADAILEDLSVPARGGHVKPDVSVTRLPRLVRRRLAADGAAVTNLLPPVGRSWTSVLTAVRAPYRRSCVVTGDDWDNRVVVAGDRLPPGPRLARDIRRMLESIGSNQAERIAVRTAR